MHSCCIYAAVQLCMLLVCVKLTSDGSYTSDVHTTFFMSAPGRPAIAALVGLGEAGTFIAVTQSVVDNAVVQFVINTAMYRVSLLYRVPLCADKPCSAA